MKKHVSGLLCLTGLMLGGPAFADSDTVSPHETQIILKRWHDYCDKASDTCPPLGVDLKKDTVKVLPRELDQRKIDIDKMLDDQAVNTDGRVYGENIKKQCKLKELPRIQMDIAVYKEFGIDGSHGYGTAEELLRSLFGNIWDTCMTVNEHTPGNLRLLAKVKLVHFKLTDDPGAEHDFLYDFDDKTGVLDVKVWKSMAKPAGYHPSNWDKFLAEN